MTSVERLHYYGGKIPNEGSGADRAVKDSVPDGWPSAGRISVEKLRARYRDDLPEILHGISFEIVGGSKVGIVGRTGAGKSSLVQAIFRLNSITGGSISIDGCNIAELPLHTVRSCIGLIPQEPELFSGTVRYNIGSYLFAIATP